MSCQITRLPQHISDDVSAAFLHAGGREIKCLLRLNMQECIFIPGSLACAGVHYLEESTYVMILSLKMTANSIVNVCIHVVTSNGTKSVMFCRKRGKNKSLFCATRHGCALGCEVRKSMVFVQRLTVYVHATPCREFRDTAITCLWPLPTSCIKYITMFVFIFVIAEQFFIGASSHHLAITDTGDLYPMLSMPNYVYNDLSTNMCLIVL